MLNLVLLTAFWSNIFSLMFWMTAVVATVVLVFTLYKSSGFSGVSFILTLLGLASFAVLIDYQYLDFPLDFWGIAGAVFFKMVSIFILMVLFFILLLSFSGEEEDEDPNE